MPAKIQEVAPEQVRSVGRLADRAADHHTLTLSAGLAFFGILSVAPAVGVGFALLRLLISPEAADALVELLTDGFPETLGFADLLEQMEDRAGRYAGIGVAVLLWPATTLASGWTRALDAINETSSTGGVRGLRGRVRGLGPGAVLVLGLFLLLAAAVTGTALVGGGRLLVLGGLVAAAVGLQFAFCLLVYRFLPTDPRPWAQLWPGAAWATLGVVVATVGFALVLQLGEGLAQQYPPAFITAVVVGLWLYAANSALLLGAEWNELRRHDGSHQQPDGREG